MSAPSGPMMNRSRSGIECSLAASQFLQRRDPALSRAPRRPGSPRSAGAATRGDSYSRAATVKVIAMLPPTMSAMAIQNSTKIRRNRLCMRTCLRLRPGERVARAAHVLDLRILARLELELAAQIADVGVDAAIVGDELAAERLLGHRFARDHLSRGAHQQLEHAEFRAGERDRPVRDAHLVHARIEHDRPDA